MSGAPHGPAEDDVGAEVVLVVVHAGCRREAPEDPRRRAAPYTPVVWNLHRACEPVTETAPALAGHPVDGAAPAGATPGRAPLAGLSEPGAAREARGPLVHLLCRRRLEDALDEGPHAVGHTAPVHVGRPSGPADAKAVRVPVAACGGRRQGVARADVVGLADVGVPRPRHADPVTGGRVDVGGEAPDSPLDTRGLSPSSRPPRNVSSRTLTGSGVYK